MADDEDAEFWGSRRVSDSEMFIEEEYFPDEEAQWDGAGHLTATEEEISMAQLNFLPSAAFSTYREGLTRRRHRDPPQQGLASSLWRKLKNLFSKGDSISGGDENTRLVRKKSFAQKTSRSSSKTSLKGNSGIWDAEALANANLESAASSHPVSHPQQSRGGESDTMDGDQRGRRSYGSMSRTELDLGYPMAGTSSAAMAPGSLVAADIDSLIPGGTSSESLRPGRSTPTSFSVSHSQRHKYSGSMSSVQFQYD